LIVSAWRITQKKHADVAFSGEGAEASGGRWNSQGTRVCYASSSISLAMLEIMVHLQKESGLSSYVVIPASFSEDQIEKLGVKDLPSDWTTYPASTSTQEIGDEWVQAQRSLVLEVPSVIVPMEVNYLINPSHPNFESIDIGEPIPVPIDPRLIDSDR
jgi:RES domain-containing protein